ncbi:MAG: alpha/beta hydrolase [Caulobacteraceae bacterium]|nr:alpha/beta hydrolase [Caulobacteraceae bacterium]
MNTGEGAALFLEPRRRTLDLTDAGAREPGAYLAGLEFGDPNRPLDAVFLHANGFNAMTYRTVLAPLSKHLRILAIDQQGHGLSPQRTPVEGRKSWLDLRDDLLALLTALNAGPLVLAGHSMGGTVSLLAAAEAPETVKALVLFDPVLPSPEVMVQWMAAQGRPIPGNGLADQAERRRSIFPSREAVLDNYRGRGAFRTWPEASLADYVIDGFRDRDDGQVELTCAPAWEASNFRAHGHDTWAAIARLRRPVRILRAELGSTCSLDDSDRLPREVADRRIETIPGSTHFLPIERPELVRAALLEACGK